MWAVGENFRFAGGGAARLRDLQAIGHRHGLRVHVLPSLDWRGAGRSSPHPARPGGRQISEATRLLRPLRFSGPGVGALAGGWGGGLLGWPTPTSVGRSEIPGLLKGLDRLGAPGCRSGLSGRDWQR